MGEMANRGAFAGGPWHKAEEGHFLLSLPMSHPWIALRCQVLEGRVRVGPGLTYMQ